MERGVGDLRSDNVVWQTDPVSREEREERRGHRGVVLWLTGLSASGKSTLAMEAEKRLFEQGYFSYVLDGDNVRHGLNGDLGFSPEDRVENIRRVGEVAKLFAEAGAIVLTAFISPPYEPPSDPELIVETNVHDVDECVGRIIGYLSDHGYVRGVDPLRALSG
jgi:adenylylsulfate kinase-like enzyme